MTARHQVSRDALELIKRFEGYRRKAARLADGRWTIGYGHTLTAREGAEVSEDDAEALLLYDLRPIAGAVNELVYTPLTQNQFDALTAFAFNVGEDNFRRSTVLRRVNEGAMIQAACALEMWRKADFEGERIVVDALVRRRAAEKALFLMPLGGWIPAPSPVLRPRVDYDVGQSMPKNPTELETSMTGDVAEAHRTVAAEPVVEPVEPDHSASTAVAAALTERLSDIMPDGAGPTVAEAEAGIDLTPPAQQAEPVVQSEPRPQPESEPDATAPAYVAERQALPAYLSAPGLFGTLLTSKAPVASEPEVAPAAEPVTAAEAAARAAEEDHDPRFDIPERNEADLSRRVVWREAPMETDATRLLGEDGLGRLSPLALVFLFLAGLAVFAGGIVWGLNTKGSGVISWALGFVGIICVAGSVYVYLERLGGRED